MHESRAWRVYKRAGCGGRDQDWHIVRITHTKTHISVYRSLFGIPFSPNSPLSQHVNHLDLTWTLHVPWCNYPTLRDANFDSTLLLG